jgi:hypothetical protein
MRAFRAEGLQPYAYVRDALAPARGRLNVWLGPVDHDSYHSLEFWACLRETHRHRRGAVPSNVSIAIRAACRLHECWQVAFATDSAMVSVPDAESFFARPGGFQQVR